MLPSIFLPGTLCDERVFSLITKDFPFHEAINLRLDSSIEDMVERVAKVNFEKFNLIGFSMGGRVAQEFSLKYPERVSKMVAIASSSDAFPEKEREIVTAALPMIHKGKFRGISDRRLKNYLGPEAYQKQELKDLIQDMAGADAKEVYLRQLAAVINRPNCFAQMKELKVPTLFIASRNDQIIPFDTIEYSARNTPGARLEVLEGIGHFIPLEAPEELVNIINQFLE